MRRLIPTAVAVALLLAVAALPAAASDYWLHVKVEEADDTRVMVNLPMSVIDKALPMLPQEHLRRSHIHMEEWDLSLGELRELWREVQDTPDATFVTVEDGDERVRVWKEGGYFKVSVVDGHGGETVDVKLPARVVDALLSGEGEELNLAAAFEALRDAGAGDLVTISGQNEQVRVWIDQIAEAR